VKPAAEKFGPVLFFKERCGAVNREKKKKLIKSNTKVLQVLLPKKEGPLPAGKLSREPLALGHPCSYLFYCTTKIQGKKTGKAEMKKMIFTIMVLSIVLGFAGTGSLAMMRDQESTSATFSAGIWEPSQVSVDIRPGTFPNVVNTRSNGLIDVAVLSTPDFDAYDVDPGSVRFGPLGARIQNWQLKDVNGDRWADMVLSFHTGDTGIQSGDVSAGLTGMTMDKKAFKGNDSVDASK
jgi:hypothetical protein